ncbi:hypothetical protein [Desulforamulus reducens]|nr:hypothetical protein [Desulforamulus reducens]
MNVSQNWWDKYCTSGAYLQCPNYKKLREMQEEVRRSKGSKLINKETGYNNGYQNANFNQGLNQRVNVKYLKKIKINPVHAHGGIAPHFCEKPWRSTALRFRVIKSLFYLKPWK